MTRWLSSVARCAISVPILLAAACVGGGEDGGDRAGEEEAWLADDSMGIRMISSFRPGSSDASDWRVNPEPLLEVGGGGPDGVEFGSVADAKMRSDGVLAVVDRLTHEIVVVDSTGSVMHRMGGRGEGPGEFQYPPVIAWSQGDTLLAFGPGSVRLSWFDPDGELARDRSLLSVLQGTPVMNGSWRLAGDGTLLGSISYTAGGGERFQQRSEVIVVAREGETVVEVGDYPLHDVIRREGWMVSSRFPHRLSVALGPDGQEMYVAETEAWEVKKVDALSGTVVQLMRVDVPRTPVTSEMIRDQRDMWRERAGDRVPPSTYVDALDEFPVPDSLPGIDRMYVDQLRNVWVARRTTWEVSTPREYVILDPSGRWIANVTVPEAMSITDITPHAVAARATGALGEPVVRVHAIQR